MTINDLAIVVPPPNVPSDVPIQPDWKNVEKTLGLSLPSDYKNFVIKYGSGLLGNFIIVFNPFSTDEGDNLFSGIDRLCSILGELSVSWGKEGLPFGIYPAKPGLIPWGADENGNDLYWLTEGIADDWPCVILSGRDNEWERFDMSMTTFLAKALKGDIKCEIWPSNFSKPKRRRKFTPY